MDDKSKAKLSPCVLKGTYCDIFNCRTTAKWFIGRMDGPLNLPMKLCDHHLQEIISTIPIDMLPIQEVEPKKPQKGNKK